MRTSQLCAGLACCAMNKKKGFIGIHFWTNVLTFLPRRHKVPIALQHHILKQQLSLPLGSFHKLKSYKK